MNEVDLLCLNLCLPLLSLQRQNALLINFVRQPQFEPDL